MHKYNEEHLKENLSYSMVRQLFKYIESSILPSNKSLTEVSVKN